MIKKMKAAILVNTNRPLVIDQVTMPTKLKLGQVLVKNTYSGICGSQVGEINASKGPDKYLPHLLGHEAVGKVIKVGMGVSKVKENDKVILHWMQSTGMDAEPPLYTWNNKKLNSGKITTFSEYTICPENRLTKMPKNLSELNAVMFGCAIPTSFGIFDNLINLKIGNAVIVVGCGGVGINIINAAKFNGAYPVIGIDISGAKILFAKKNGADFTYKISKNNSLEQILLKIKKKFPIDYLIDNTGNVDVINKSYRLIDKKSTLILVGVPNYKKNINIHSLDMHFGKKILGVEGGNVNPELDFKRYANYFREKKYHPKKLITKIYSLEDVNKAINLMGSNKTKGRLILKC
jgi:Zn-dependent alcohol dehydrogenase